MKDYQETAFAVKHTSMLEWLKRNWHSNGRIKSGRPQRETESPQSVNLCQDFLLSVKANSNALNYSTRSQGTEKCVQAGLQMVSNA